MLSRYHSLDAFRGLAAVSVFLTHWIGATTAALHQNEPDVIQYVFDAYTRLFRQLLWFTNPHPGVVAFIVLSGFCIHLGTLTQTAAGRTTTDWPAFFRRRLWRIGPVYWLGCLFGIVAVLIANQGPDNGSEIRASYFLYKLLAIPAWLPFDWSASAFEQGNGPLATVMAEWWLYLIYPLVFLLAKRFGWKSALAVCFVTSYLAYKGFYFERFDQWWLISSSPFGFLLFWTIGAFCASVFHGRHRICARFTLPAMLALYVICVVAAHSVLRSDFSRNLAFSILCGLILISVCRAEENNSRAQGPGRVLRGLAWAGERSYTLYAIHSPLLAIALFYITGWVDLGAPNATAIRCVPLVMSLLGALVFYECVEKPSHRRGKSARQTQSGLATNWNDRP